MPSITTHHIFSKIALENMPKEITKNFKKETDIYHTFSQSHDYLFYYIGKNRKKINDLGHYAHHNNTQAYILNIIKYIKDNKLQKEQQLVAYLYGVISHYVLDTTCHPYIFYKTGVYRKSERNTHKYKGEHTHIEKDLDALYYKEYYNKNYNKCNISKEIIRKPLLSKELVNAITSVYKETYNEENIGYYYNKGIKSAKLISSIFFNDRFGIKKMIYKLIDFISFKKLGRLASYSTFNKKPNIEYLNNDKIKWNHPSDNSLKYSYSFDELINISLKKYLKIINEVNEVLYNNIDINNLIKVILDLDYSTGLIIKDNKKMMFFEQ